MYIYINLKVGTPYKLHLNTFQNSLLSYHVVQYQYFIIIIYKYTAVYPFQNNKI